MKKIFLLAFLALSMVRALAQPSTAAAPPTANAANVLSLFGSHYTQDSRAAGAGTPYGTWRQPYGGATVISYSNIGGSDTTIEYSSLDYVVPQFTSAIDASAYDSIHLDIYSPTLTGIYLDLITTAAGAVENSDTIHLTPGQWNSITIPLSVYTINAKKLGASNSPCDFSSFLQMNFIANQIGVTPQGTGGTIYLENIYLVKASGKPTITGFSIAPQTLGTSTYTITDPTTNSTGAFTYTSSNSSVATVSGNIITIKGVGSSVITATEAADANYTSASVTTTFTVDYAGPTIAAPVPTTAALYTKSLWGDAYTNVSGINWNTFNGGTVYTTPTIGGKSTIKYSGLNYIGSQLAGDSDVSAYDSIHLDIWSPNVTSLTIGLISITGGTKEIHVTVPLTVSGWNYVSIPLTSYAGVDLTKFRQMIFIGATPTTGGVVYLQNIYFVAAAGKPTLTGFTIPTQIVGVNSTYSLGSVTSTSTGAITYSSSNTAVATVSGTVVTIVGAGTSTITANEAADFNYTAATFTTLLTVDYAGPTTAAPVPTTAALYAKSLWGDAYTNVSGINWNAFNGGTQYTNPTIGGKSTIKYSGLGYIGSQLGSDLDVSTFDSIHLDIWSPNVTSLTIGLISLTGGTKEIHVTVPLTVSGWNYVSIPLTSYAGVDLTKFRQMIFIGSTPTTGGIVYLQNIYFVNVVGKPTISGFTIPAQTVGTSTYTITDPTTNSTGAFTYTSSNTAVATISGHIINILSAGTSTITATEAADANYSAGSATAVLTVNYAGPTTAASAPTAASSDVISLWGDTYTNVTGTTWNPYWGQPAPGITYSSTTVGGKTTLGYSNLGYEGVQFASNINASLMDSLHFDVWTPNCTSFDLYLINTGNGNNSLVTVKPTTSGWNSITLPMSSYALEASSVGQFKIVANTPSSGAVLYFQNIYFFKVAGKPTLSSFTLPSSLTTASAPFSITAPTSNSHGAFTYTSGNTAVATISGSTVTIHSAGTAVITATQAADPMDGYVSGSTTAVLTVAYPGPTTAAAVPTASSSNVISLWGDTYTNLSGTTWNPYWGQPAPGVTTSTITVGGKTTLKYSNLGYEGVQFASNINASGMNLLHFDLWTPNCTSLELYLINTGNGANQLYTITPTTSGWNSINIPMSNFSNEASSIGQFKFVSNAPTSGAELYFQNIYFVNSTAIWTGTTSSSFNTPTNWQYGLVPTSTTSVSIPASLINEPVLSANTTLASVALNGTLGLNGKTLTLTGAVTGSGSLSGTPTSSLVVAGTVGTLNFTSWNNSLQNLTITSGSVTLGNALNVYGTFTPTSGTFNTGGNLTLKSTSVTNTAVVGVVGGSINGTVTVERNIPAGKRTYRDLGPEVANAGSVFANWQEGGVNNNGYGIQITGSQGTTVGYDATTGLDYSLTGNHSMFTYLNNTWDSVTNTMTTTLNPYQGYRVLVRGDRSGSLQTQFNYSTGATIRTKGNLVTGTVTFNNLTSGVGSYSLVANPYVSPVSWNSVVAASTGINGSFWYNDPTFTVDGYATFVSYNTTNGISNPMSQSLMDGNLQPGQGFFVENTTSSPSLVFTEACKVPAQSKTAIFGTTTINRIAAGLYRNGTNVDGAVTAFGNNNAATIGKEDAIKFPNVTENIAFTVANKDLCINGTTMPSATDVLSIHLYNLKANTSYTLRLDASQFDGKGMQAFVKDNVSKTETLLSGNNTSVSFTTTAADAGSYAGRYSIVFGSGTLPISSIKLTATVQTGNVVIKWNTIGESNVANYKVQRSTNGVTFTDIATQTAANLSTASYSINDSKAVTGTNYYRIKVTNNNGSVNYSSVVTVVIGKVASGITAYPNPLVGQHLNVAFNNLEAGTYDVAIFNMAGNKVFAKSITHNASTSVEQLSINNHLATGTYTVHVTNANGVACQSQIEVK